MIGITHRDVMGALVSSPQAKLLARGSTLLATALDLFLLVAMLRGA
jgi:hypothetical protein